jgi:predicted transcriptional regulator
VAADSSRGPELSSGRLGENAAVPQNEARKENEYARDAEMEEETSAARGHGEPAVASAESRAAVPLLRRARKERARRAATHCADAAGPARAAGAARSGLLRELLMKWTSTKTMRLRKLYTGGVLFEEIAGALRGTKSAIRNRVKNLHLRRNFFRRAWRTADDAKLRRLYADSGSAEVARQLNRTISATYGRAKKLGMKKSAAFMASPAACRLGRGDNVGATFRFLPGHIPANKGLRRPGYAPGRMRETQFKRGQRPHTWLPVGTVKANADGYLRRKISDLSNNGSGANDKNWEFVHRRVWEDVHGPVPKGHRIWWRDGNHENCALGNLELLSDQEHMARTTINNLPRKLKDTIQLAGRLKRRIRSHEKQAERPAQSSLRNDRGAEGRRKAYGH